MNLVRRLIPASHNENLPALAWLVEQNLQVEAKVEQCAEQISAITTALRAEIALPLVSKNAEQALLQTEQVRRRVKECAEQLHSLNTALTEEIKERKKLERLLAGAQIKLTSAQIELVEMQVELARKADQHQKTLGIAFHDSMTGLPSRNLFDDRLEHALAQARRYHRSLAVMFITLTGFTAIRNTHGASIADKLSNMAAERFKFSVRISDTLCRQEGDEFLYLQEEIKDSESPVRIARKLCTVIAQPYELDDAQLNLVPSIGVAVYPQHGASADQLINNAAMAMYKAKRGNGGTVFYDASLT